MTLIPEGSWCRDPSL